MWYAYDGEWMNWYVLSTESAKEIIKKNKSKHRVVSLEEYTVEQPDISKTDFEDVVGQDSLTRFDNPKPKRQRNNRRNKSRNRKNHSNRNAKKG
jgi:hypothetical protein